MYKYTITLTTMYVNSKLGRSSYQISWVRAWKR
jgi:hypothetical protein